MPCVVNTRLEMLNCKVRNATPLIDIRWRNVGKVIMCHRSQRLSSPYESLFDSQSHICGIIADRPARLVPSLLLCSSLHSENIPDFKPIPAMSGSICGLQIARQDLELLRVMVHYLSENRHFACNTRLELFKLQGLKMAIYKAQSVLISCVVRLISSVK